MKAKRKGKKVWKSRQESKRKQQKERWNKKWRRQTLHYSSICIYHEGRQARVERVTVMFRTVSLALNNGVFKLARKVFGLETPRGGKKRSQSLQVYEANRRWCRLAVIREERRGGRRCSKMSYPGTVGYMRSRSVVWVWVWLGGGWVGVAECSPSHTRTPLPHGFTSNDFVVSSFPHSW